MNSRFLITKTLSSLLIILVTFVASCSKDSQGHLKPSSVHSPSDDSTNSPSGTIDGGGGDTDRPSFEEISESVKALIVHRFAEQVLATNAQTYKDQSGTEYLDMPISVKADRELLAMLQELNEDLASRGLDSDRLHRKWNIKLRKQGPCNSSEGDREGAAKLNDLYGPICLSLPRIQAMTRRADLNNAMAALLMHELSHAHGANEDLAKRVERYFSLPAVQNISSMLTLRRAISILRLHFRGLRTALEATPIERPQVAQAAQTLADSTLLLNDQIKSSGIQWLESSKETFRAFSDLQEKALSMKVSAAGIPSRENDALIRSELDQSVEIFNHATASLRKAVGLNIVNFKDVLCAYDSPELCNGI